MNIQKKRFYQKYIDKQVVKPKHKIYKSWVPVNLGDINYGYIGNDFRVDSQWESCAKNAQTKEVVYINLKPQISDQISLDISKITRLMPGQDKPVVYISLLLNKDNEYEGQAGIYYLSDDNYHYVKNKMRKVNNDIDVEYKSFQKVDSLQVYEKHKKVLTELGEYLVWKDHADNTLDENAFAFIKGNFKLKQNGLIEIFDILVAATKFKSNYFVLSTLKEEQHIYSSLGKSFVDSAFFDNTVQHKLEKTPLVLYTAIKRIIHMDNHHHSKIDTMIPALPIDEFDSEVILRSMAFRVKEIESTLRRLQEEPEKGYASNAKGVLSYMESFAIINDCSDSSQSLKLAKSVMQSIESVNKRVEKYVSCSEKIFALGKVIIGLLVSLSILFTGFMSMVISAKSSSLYSVDKSALNLVEYILMHPHQGYIYIVLSGLGLTLSPFIFAKVCFRNKMTAFIGEERVSVVKAIFKKKIVYVATALLASGFLIWLVQKLEEIRGAL